MMLYVDNMLSSIRESFDQHMAFVYEDVCREFCLDQLKSGVMSFSAIGGWWIKNEEIDLVALDEENGAIWFAECKWSGKAVGEDVYRNLQRKARLVVWRPKDRLSCSVKAASLMECGSWPVRMMFCWWSEPGF